MNTISGYCPVCGEGYNLALGPQSEITSPDKGEWCFAGGTIYIHEEFRYNNTGGSDE